MHNKFSAITLPNGQHPTQHIAVHAFRWHNYPIERLRNASKIATVGLMSYDLAGAWSECASGNSPLHPETANCPEKADDVDGRTWPRAAYSISGALDVWSRGDPSKTKATGLYDQGTTGSNEGPAIPKAQLHGGVAFYSRYGRTQNDNDANVQPGDTTRSSTGGVEGVLPASCFGVRSLEAGTEAFASYSGVYDKMLNPRRQRGAHQHKNAGRTLKLAVRRSQRRTKLRVHDL